MGGVPGTVDCPSLSLPDTPESPTPHGKGAASAMPVLWELRDEGRLRKETAPTKTLTPSPIPSSHPFCQPQVWCRGVWGDGAGSGSSANCHSPGLPSGAGVSNKGSFGLASSRRMFTRRSDEKLSPNAVL